MSIPKKRFANSLRADHLTGTRTDYLTGNLNGKLIVRLVDNSLAVSPQVEPALWLVDRAADDVVSLLRSKPDGRGTR